jgi:hypothetical protein
MEKKTILYTLLIFCACTTQAQNTNLRINEILTRNSTVAMDDFFEYDDWIEIYNPPGSGITNLAGYYLSDNADSLIAELFVELTNRVSRLSQYRSFQLEFLGHCVIAMAALFSARGAAIIGIFHDAEVRDRVADRLFDVSPLPEAA